MISRRNLDVWLTICSLMLVLVSAAAAQTLHVPDEYGTIQDAINAAPPGDEIEVAAGTYYEAINFNGKAVRLYSSDGPNVTTIDGTGAYHVVQCVSGEGPGTILEGFTITGGNANGSLPDNHGGGMYIDRSDPVVSNCIFSGNSANGGGGMFIYESEPVVSNCTFSGNNANDRGGGLAIDWFCATTVTGCTFSGNLVTGAGPGHNGGGLAVSFDGWHDVPNEVYKASTVTNCTFSGNSASYKGGGMYNGNHAWVYTHDPLFPPTKLMNCTFIGNSAQAGGGAMYNMQSGPEITNCTFAYNTSPSGGAMLTYYGGESDKMIPILTNCIFWADTEPEIADAAYSGDPCTTVNYSDVQGGWLGTANIDADPMFADADGRLLPGSPCIDAGDNGAVPADITTDLDGNPRFVDCPDIPDTGNGTPPIVDMGAYEAIIAAVQVAIDIKPGSWPNAINLGSHGLIPVAIFSDVDFDATTVDPDTVELAGANIEVKVKGKSNKYMAHEEDVDGDGLIDLVVQVATANLDPDSLQDGWAVLTGETYDGEAIEGEDEITIVPEQ